MERSPVIQYQAFPFTIVVIERFGSDDAFQRGRRFLSQ
jgi:hypothetical protein